MVSVKERTVNGRKYLYISATSSYKGKKKRFEKSLGPKGMEQKELDGKIEFYTELLDLRSTLYRVYMEAKETRFKYLPTFYSIYLAMIRNFYSSYLTDLYPSELEKYRDDLRVKYVHNTTALEGNTLTLREAAMVLDDGIAPKGKKLREIHEIENFRRLDRYLRGYKGNINIDLIKKIHELVQRNIDDEQAGNLRRIQVGIVGSRFEPPPAIFVEEELEDLVEWYSGNTDELPPFELACMFHYRFVHIHPFVDGNGRVARELLNFILERNGYPPMIVEVTDREEYLKRLKLADEGDPKPFLELLAIKMITDYESVILSFQKRAMKGLEELSPDEIKEIMETLMWFMSLMKEFEVRIPAEAAERIGSIKRYFEITGNKPRLE
ncbi:MAG: Fic family protein [Candidatus Thermoplasmatota archaeon]|nr:Fic family protein [Candidatus Thermoplasmatota archaeon]